MSQFYLPGSGGGGGGDITFTTDDGNATTSGDAINILAQDNVADNDNGIRTVGASQTITIELTNRATGSAGIVGALTGDLITFDCGTPTGAGTFLFKVRVVGYTTTGPAGVGYEITGTVRTDGTTTATLIGTPDKIVNEDASLTAGDCALVVSGNDAIVRATGVAGVTITYNAVLEYVFIATP